jgi:acyl carrier protein phosphodiesterase
MNFLAHCFLARHREEWLLGSFLADYLKNAAIRSLPEAVQEGVRLHRRIDTYTDRHPEVLKGVRRLYPAHGKYAPVVVDIFYDYFLAINWARYTDEPLADFAQGVYVVLQKNAADMPPRLQENLSLMIASDWLQSYRTTGGIAYAFERMKKRASRPEQFDGVMDSLSRDHDKLNEEFKRFFPEVMRLEVALG